MRPKDQGLAALIARWVLVVPVSFATGIAVGVLASAVLGPRPSNDSDPFATIPAALSMAIATITYLATARGLAPFWKPGVVAVLATILVITNLSETSSAIWAVLIQHTEPKDRIRLAEALGLSLTAMVFLVVSTRTLRKGPTAG